MYILCIWTIIRTFPPQKTQKYKPDNFLCIKIFLPKITQNQKQKKMPHQKTPRCTLAKWHGSFALDGVGHWGGGWGEVRAALRAPQQGQPEGVRRADGPEFLAQPAAQQQCLQVRHPGAGGHRGRDGPTGAACGVAIIPKRF